MSRKNFVKRQLRHIREAYARHGGSKKEYVYTLRHPVTNVVFYVGMTRQLVNRFSNHMVCHQLPCSTPLKRWKAELAAQGLAPIFTVIHVVEGYAKDAEQFFIEHFSRRGATLLQEKGATRLQGKQNIRVSLRAETVAKLKESGEDISLLVDRVMSDFLRERALA